MTLDFGECVVFSLSGFGVGSGLRVWSSEVNVCPLLSLLAKWEGQKA